MNYSAFTDFLMIHLWNVMCKLETECHPKHGCQTKQSSVHVELQVCVCACVHTCVFLYMNGTDQCALCHRYLAKLSSVGSISDEKTCEKLRGLIQRQVQICKRNLEVMDAVRRGAQLAIDECQYQFRNRRWNCSTLETVPVFGKVVTQGEQCSGNPQHPAPNKPLESNVSLASHLSLLHHRKLLGKKIVIMLLS